MCKCDLRLCAVFIAIIFFYGFIWLLYLFMGAMWPTIQLIIHCKYLNQIYSWYDGIKQNKHSILRTLENDKQASILAFLSIICFCSFSLGSRRTNIPFTISTMAEHNQPKANTYFVCKQMGKRKIIAHIESAFISKCSSLQCKHIAAITFSNSVFMPFSLLFAFYFAFLWCVRCCFYFLTIILCSVCTVVCPIALVVCIQFILSMMAYIQFTLPLQTLTSLFASLLFSSILSAFNVLFFFYFFLFFSHFIFSAVVYNGS